MPTDHSDWSPSGFEAIMLCPGKKVLEAGLPRTTSVYAAEGTAAHQLLTWALEQNLRAEDWIGEVIPADGFEFTVDADMARYVQVCVDYVRDVAGADGIVLVDRRVHFHDYLGVEEGTAFGTLDVAVLKGDEIIVVDFKYGQGVEVSAEGNPQMSLYALGILSEVRDLGDFARVRLVISQPRVNTRPSEYDLSVEELEAWAENAARAAVVRCWDAMLAGDTIEGHLTPGDKQCRFCQAKATCPALREAVEEQVNGDGLRPATPEEFAAMPIAPVDSAGDAKWVAAALSKVDLIEDWCKAVRAEAERRLLAGEAVPGFKIVQGKRGARQWSDPEAAKALLRDTFRLPIEKAFDLKLISPTSAEKLAKAGDIGPRQWPKAQGLIVQPEGKPHVAPDSDPRPAIAVRPVVEDFDTVADANDFA